MALADAIANESSSLKLDDSKSLAFHETRFMNAYLNHERLYCINSATLTAMYMINRLSSFNEYKKDRGKLVNELKMLPIDTFDNKTKGISFSSHFEDFTYRLDRSGARTFFSSRAGFPSFMWCNETTTLFRVIPIVLYYSTDLTHTDHDIAKTCIEAISHIYQDTLIHYSVYYLAMLMLRIIRSEKCESFQAICTAVLSDVSAEFKECRERSRFIKNIQAALRSQSEPKFSDSARVDTVLAHALYIVLKLGRVSEKQKIFLEAIIYSATRPYRYAIAPLTGCLIGLVYGFPNTYKGMFKKLEFMTEIPKYFQYIDDKCTRDLKGSDTQ